MDFEGISNLDSKRQLTIEHYGEVGSQMNSRAHRDISMN